MNTHPENQLPGRLRRKQTRLTTFLRRALQPCLAIWALAPVLAPQHAAAATTYVWQEGAGGSWDFTSPNWSGTNSRWNGGSTSAINNIASFGAVAPTGGDTAITVNGAIKLSGLTFTDGDDSNYFDIQAGTGTLTFTGKAVVTATAGSLGVISTSLSTDTSSTHSTDTLTFTADSTTASAGTILLKGNNPNYSVPSLTITGGALVYADATSALPDAATVVGVTQIAGNTSTGAGNLDLFGNNGIIASLSGAANGTISNNLGAYATLTVGGPKTSQSSTTFAGVLTDTSAAIATTNNPTPFAALGLTVQAPVGGYTLVLIGTANDYSGMTVVGDGAHAATLQAGATNAFSANSGVNVLANGTLDLNGFSQSIADLDGTGVGTVTNKKQGTTATLTLAGDGASDTLTSAANLIDHTTNSAYGTLALTKSGGYTQVLAGTNTYGGATNVTGGFFAAGSSTGLSANSAYTVNLPGILDLNGFNASIGSLAGNGYVTNGSGNVTGSTPNGTVTLTTGNDGTDTTFAGLITNGSGQLVLTKTGLGTFTITDINNQYTAGTNIHQGVLSFRAGALSTGLVTFTGNSTLQFDANNTQDTSTINGLKINDGVTATIDTKGNNVTFGTALQTGPQATGALTKTGAGTLTLSAANFYTGGTTVDGGTLAINADAGLGAASGGVTLNGGTLEATSNTITTRTISLGASGGTISTSGNTQLQINGLITGSGPLDLSCPVVGTSAIFMAGTANNTYTGLTTVQVGLLGLESPGFVAIPGNLLVNSGAEVDIDANEQIASAATVTVNGNLGFNAEANVQQTIGTLNGGGSIFSYQNNTATLVVGAGNFSGQIVDNSGTVALTKQGPGTLILSNSNGYSGATTINGGTLEIDGSTESQSSVTVNSGGALAGTGTVGGTVTVNAGGFLNPGTSSTPGALTTGNLILTTGATSTFRVGGATSDLVAVNGNFTLAGNLSIIGDPGLMPGVYTLFTITGSIFNSGFGNVTGAAGFSTIYDFSNFVGGGGDVSLLVDYLGTPQYWDGTHTTATGSIAGGSGTWNATPTNWTSSDGTANAHWQGGTALFSGPGGTVTLGGPISAQALFFNSTGYTLTGSTLTLAGPDPAIDVVNAGTTTTVASVVAGKAGLAATGAGTLILTNGANTYTGGTTVTSGTLQLGTSAAAAKISSAGAIAVGSGGTLSILNVSGNSLANAISNGLIGIGTLDIDSAHTTTLSGALTDGTVGQLALTQSGTGTTILTNAGNTYSGTTTVSQGTLQIGTSALAGSIGASSPVSVINGGTLTLVKVSGGVLANNINDGLGNSFQGFSFVNANSATALTLTGILSDGAGSLLLNQTGTGTTTLTGIDTYSNGTIISAGTLQVGNGITGNLTGGAAVGLTGSGVLALDLPTLSTFSPSIDLNSANSSLKAIQSGTLTVSNIISGTGAFDQNGTGTTTLSTSESYTGATNVNAGTLVVEGSLASSIVHVGTNTTLVLDGSLAGNATLTGVGDINATGAQIAGTLAVTGGTWSGTGTVAKAVTSSASVFTIASGSNLTAYGGVNVTGGSLGGAGTITGSVNDTSSTSFTFGGVIAGSSSTLTMNHAGTTLTLDGVNTYGGPTTVSAGTLQIGDGMFGSIGGSTVITVSGAGALVMDFPGSPPVYNMITLDGTGTSLQAIQAGATYFLTTISGSGTFDQNGSGFTIFQDAQSYTGPTNVNAGVLQLDSSLASSVVHIGTNGQLTLIGTVDGNATLTGNGAIYGSGSSGQINGTLAVTGGTWAGQGTVEKAVTSSAGTFTIYSGADLIAPAGVNVTGGAIAATDGTATLTGSLNYTSSSSSTFAGIIADGAKPSTVTVNHAGSTLTLTGNSIYTGATTVTAGTLNLAEGSSIASASPVTIGSAGTLTVGTGSFFENPVTDNGHLIATGGSSDAFDFSNNISGTGDFTKNGGGFVSLFGTNTYKGGTTISGGILYVLNTSGSGTGTGVVNVNGGGTLAGSGTITGATKLNLNGVIEPSAVPPGVTPVLQTLNAGALTWNGGGDIKLELGANGVSDALALSGALTKGTAGSFDLILLDDGVTDTLSNYTLLTFKSTNFKLSDFNLELPANVTGTLVETSTSLMLDNAMDPPPTPGEDAVVADAPVSADSTEPAVSTPETIVVTPTPEPGSAMLLSLGGIALLGWRRRRTLV